MPAQACKWRHDIRHVRIGRHYRPASTTNQSGLVTLTFNLLTLKVVSESRVTLVTSMTILVFLGLSVLNLGPMYATDSKRQTDRRQIKPSLNAPPIRGGHNKLLAALAAVCPL